VRDFSSRYELWTLSGKVHVVALQVDEFHKAIP